MRGFIEHYGYWAVFLGTFFEGETVLVLGGFAAHRGYLHLAGVLLAALAGSALGDALFFLVGHHYGARLLARIPQLKERAVRIRELLARYDVPVILAMRFLYGLRVAGPIVLGATRRVATRRFFAWNLLGAVLWSLVIGLLGYAFGNTLELLIDNFRHHEQKVLWAIVAVGAALFGVRHGKRLWLARRERRDQG